MGSVENMNGNSSNTKACSPFTAARRLREMLKDPSKLIVCPGVYDGLSARLVLSAGYDAMYMFTDDDEDDAEQEATPDKTGAGVSMSRLGWADLGLATLNDMRASAETIASLNPSVPLIADADTGYGGPIMVTRTVTQYARSGVAALHIEDQVQEKRCGHLLGKQIVDRETYYSRLRAAVAARDALGSDMLLIARTDSRQTYGFDEAVERLQEAVKIGVDIVFLEALQSREEMEKVCRIMSGTPVLLNNVSGGVTPEYTIEEISQMGFRIAIYPGLCLGPVIEGIRKELHTLSTTRKSGPRATLSGPKDAFNLCGLQECLEIDQQAGGKAYSKLKI